MPVAPPQPNGRRKDERHLRELWHFLQRNRLLILGAPVLVLLATLAFLQYTTPIYESAASIRIDEERSNVAVLDALSSLSSGSEIDTEMEELRSRTLAEAVVDSLDLHVALVEPRRAERSSLISVLSATRDVAPGEYTLTKIGERWRLTWDLADGAVSPLRPLGRGAREYATGDAVVLPGMSFVIDSTADAHEKFVLEVEAFPEAVRTFAKRVDVSRPNRDANFVVARYAGPDQQLVREVPNTMARLFIMRRNSVQNTEARSTVSFLSEQLDTLTRQLTGAENALQDLRENEQIVAPQAAAEAQVARLAEMQAERDILSAEREALGALFDDVTSTAPVDGRSPFRRLVAFPTLFRNPATAELLSNLADVENSRAELLDRRTMDDPQVAVLTGRIEDLEQQLATITRTYLQGLTNQEASLNAQLQRFGDQLATVPAREIRYARLLRQAEVLEEIYTMLSTRLKEAQIVAAVEDPSVRVVDPAITPRKPVKPKPVLSLALAVLVGLTLGAGAAFAKENMDDRVRTRDDVIELTHGAPILGTIPRIPEALLAGGGNGKSTRRGKAPAFHNRLVTGRDPRNPASEAYRSLRTNITFSRPEQAPRTIVFTSPTPGDGKSTSAANLAITLAQQELSVLLVDADMRRGVMHDVFGTAREPGLSNVLLGRAEIEQAVKRTQVGDVELDFMPMGTIPPNPAELLGSPRMATLLARLAERYEVVILDAPPLAVVTDAALLGTNADGVILVARSGVTEKGALSYAMDQILAVRAPLLGVVLNDVDTKKDRYYGGYAAASYYYAAEDGR